MRYRTASVSAAASGEIQWQMTVLPDKCFSHALIVYDARTGNEEY